MPLTLQDKSTDIVITMTQNNKTLTSILVPYWWSQSTQITAVVNAVVGTGATYRSVNTNDVVRFTIDWMACENHDHLSLLDVDVTWKVWEEEV